MPGNRFSIAVQTHPGRMEQGYLRDVLEGISPTFDYDSARDRWNGANGAVVSIHVDRGAGQWVTAQSAWAAYDPKATHHVVLQDDSVLCADFIERLDEAVISDQCAYSLYFGNEIGQLRRDAAYHAKRGAGWVDLRRMYWGVAIALPVRLVPGMLAWTSDLEVPENWKNRRSDSRIGRFCEHHDVTVRYVLPSIVDHRVGPSLFGKYKSLMPNQRVAWWFANNPQPES